MHILASTLARHCRLGPRSYHCDPFRLILVGIAIAIQTLIVVEARPQDLITGVHGMADLIRRAMPPDFSKLPAAVWPTLQTVDIALFGTFVGIIIAVPLALLAAANMTPSRYAYYAARAIIGFTRAVPDLVWALLFVTAVGLGPFPGGLALGVHSVGMLGRLFAETIEQMDMGPIQALELTGARRIQVFSHGIVPRSCRRCWGSASIVWTKTYVLRWCWASSAPAALDLNYCPL